MAVASRASSMSMMVEDFLACSLPEGKAELVHGELRVTPPPGAPHGVAGSNLVFMLTAHVRRHGLGRVFGDSFGYELEDYLFSGTQLIWVVDPVRRTVMIVAADAPVRWLREGDTLVGEPSFPGSRTRCRTSSKG